MKIIEKSVAIIAAILLVLTSSISVAVTKTKGTVATDTLRLRKEASIESDVLDLLYKDDEIEIIGEEGDWYKINYKDYTGYVSKEYITKSDDTKVSEKDNTTNNENENKDNNASVTANLTDVSKASVNEYANKEATVSSDVDVYILPLIGSNVISKYKQDTKVKIINVAGAWAYVKTDDVAGWVKMEKLSVQGSSNSTEKNETDNSQSTTDEQAENNQVNENEQNSNEQENNTNAENTEATETTENTETTEATYEAKTLYIQSSSGVNVREGATTDADIITTLLLNTSVKVVGEESDWYKVEVNGKSGYILKSLLGENKVEVTTRSAEPERTQSTTSSSKQTTTKTTTAATTETKAKETTTTKTSTKTETKTETSTASTSSKGEEVVAYAKKFLGCPYVYGGSGPSTFDCSGFTMYVFKHFGISLPHNAATQSGYGTYVARSNLQPGDIIIFNDYSNSYMGHVGIYVGGGNFIHASSGSGQIIITSLSNAYHNARYVTARRLV